MSDLFTPVQLGRLQLNNRIIMAPMTRSRAANDGTPTAIMKTYYQQRASAGLIITEGVYPSEDGKGYCRTPGIVSNAHCAAWQSIAAEVHQAGGKIVMQLMHCGRVAHKYNKSANARTVAPSAIQAKGMMYTEHGMQAMDTPVALTTDEIKTIIQQYKTATQKAFDAGFDGVELHCTSGYLPAQFLSTGTNQRSDEYGGSLENRLRFVMDVLQAMISVDGADRVGIRICPGNPFNDLYDENPQNTFAALLITIQPLGLAYLHAIKSPAADIHVIDMAKTYFKGPLIINDGFDAESANSAITNNDADAVAFGRAFIANPDLVNRFKHNHPLASFDQQRLYTADEKGYCDYPVFA
jgi:N-ethylmaleimide reductase